MQCASTHQGCQGCRLTTYQRPQSTPPEQPLYKASRNLQPKISSLMPGCCKAQHYTTPPLYQKKTLPSNSHLTCSRHASPPASPSPSSAHPPAPPHSNWAPVSAPDSPRSPALPAAQASSAPSAPDSANCPEPGPPNLPISPPSLRFLFQHLRTPPPAPSAPNHP
jgi:hypothetical protein